MNLDVKCIVCKNNTSSYLYCCKKHLCLICNSNLVKPVKCPHCRSTNIYYNFLFVNEFDKFDKFDKFDDYYFNKYIVND